MWQLESGITNVLTFPVPGEFAIQGGDRGLINEVDRDHNTLKFVADAVDRDAYTPYFDGEVYFKFETETKGLFVIKNPELGATFSGHFVTVPHDPVRGAPPLIENGFSGKTLLLTYCPNGQERFEFKTATEVVYKDSWPTEPVGNYSCDPMTSELAVTFAFGWEFRIKLRSEIASVNFREGAFAPWRTDHTTFRIF